MNKRPNNGDKKLLETRLKQNNQKNNQQNCKTLRML